MGRWFDGESGAKASVVKTHANDACMAKRPHLMAAFAPVADNSQPGAPCAHSARRAPTGTNPVGVQARLRSAAGFTLGELMVTLLMVGLLTLAVAAGIGVAVKAHGEVQQVNEAQAVLNNAVTAVSDELRFAYDVNEVTVGASTNIGGNGTTALAFNSTVRDYRLYLSNSALAPGGASVITLNAINAVPNADGSYSAPSVGASGKTSDALPLVNTAAGAASSSTRFSAQLASLAWDKDEHLWTYEITVTGGAQPVSSGTLAVRAVNNW